MANLTLENIPDEMIEQIKKQAKQKNQSVNEQAIALLKIGLEKSPPPLEFLISPGNDPTWEERRKATPKILGEIRSRRRVRPDVFGLPDSKDLIREDRDR